jgi:anti-sigma B factor antagonist
MAEPAIRHHADGDADIIEAPEDLDVYTAGDFRSVLVNLDLTSRCRLVVDMERTRFIDSTGLGVLLGAHKRAAARGGSVAVVTTSEYILGRLSACGLLGLIGVHESVADALKESCRG